MFDPAACYSDYLRAPVVAVNALSEELPRATGTKRKLEEEPGVAPAQSTVPDPIAMPTPSTLQISSVFLQNDVARTRLPGSVSEIAISATEDTKWPPRHSGVFREEGGVKSR